MTGNLSSVNEKGETTMDCKHELKDLMGTADGIVCRKCGRVFADYKEVLAADQPAAEKPATTRKKASKKEAKPE